MKPFIKVPIKILTKKIAKNKQDSLFYAGKNIADIQVGNRNYVLTTSGQYEFSLKESGPSITVDSCNLRSPAAKALRTLTDAKIKKLDDNGLVNNWGWFGINVWEGNKEVGPIVVYSQYDEALSAFIDFVEKDLNKS